MNANVSGMTVRDKYEINFKAKIEVHYFHKVAGRYKYS